MIRKVKLHIKAECIRLSYTVTLFPLIAIFACIGFALGWFTPNSEVPDLFTRFIESMLSVKKLYILLIVLPVLIFLFVGLIKSFELPRVEKVRLRKILTFLLQKVLAALRVFAGLCLGFLILNNFSELNVSTQFATLGWFLYFLFSSIVISVYSREWLDTLLVQ